MEFDENPAWYRADSPIRRLQGAVGHNYYDSGTVQLFFCANLSSFFSETNGNSFFSNSQLLCGLLFHD